MTQPFVSSSVFAAERQPLHASAIARLSRAEVIPLAREELNRFLALLETLSPAD